MGATHFTYDVSEFPLTERIQTVSLAQSVASQRRTGQCTRRNDESMSTTVLIENDRIISVGAASDIEVPASYQSIDLAGKTILPVLRRTRPRPLWARRNHSPSQLVDACPSRAWRHHDP